jgi:hypothetical protein
MRANTRDGPPVVTPGDRTTPDARYARSKAPPLPMITSGADSGRACEVAS